MNYRVRLDLSFANKADAESLMAHAKNLSQKAVSINEGKPNEEIAFIDYHICRHDENAGCNTLERIEIRKLAVRIQ